MTAQIRVQISEVSGGVPLNRDGKIEKSQLTASKLLTHLPWSPRSIQLQHPNSQFLQHVDHRLGHHSELLRYLFVHEADERSVHETD